MCVWVWVWDVGGCECMYSPESESIGGKDDKIEKSDDNADSVRFFDSLSPCLPQFIAISVRQKSIAFITTPAEFEPIPFHLGVCKAVDYQRN